MQFLCLFHELRISGWASKRSLTNLERTLIIPIVSVICSALRIFQIWTCTEICIQYLCVWGYRNSALLWWNKQEAMKACILGRMAWMRQPVKDAREVGAKDAMRAERKRRKRLGQEKKSGVDKWVAKKGRQTKAVWEPANHPILRVCTPNRCKGLEWVS